MPEEIVARLRAGQPLHDAEFDRLYPSWARSLSSIHWTPVDVARRAAQLLVVHPGMRVLDVGAGVGKFCLVGALTTAGVFHGVEQRLHFVETAQALARQLGLANARFIHGNMMSLDWRGYAGFYLYNPFAENLGSLTEPLDTVIAAVPQLFEVYARFVAMQLGACAPGTRVVTFHGFGGELPTSYALAAEEPVGSECLQLWIKG